MLLTFLVIETKYCSHSPSHCTVSFNYKYIESNPRISEIKVCCVLCNKITKFWTNVITFCSVRHATSVFNKLHRCGRRTQLNKITQQVGLCWPYLQQLSTQQGNCSWICCGHRPQLNKIIQQAFMCQPYHQQLPTRRENWSWIFLLFGF